MNIVSGLIVGTFVGAFLCAATSDVIWLPVGLFVGAFLGELQTRRVAANRSWAEEIVLAKRRLRRKRPAEQAEDANAR